MLLTDSLVADVKTNVANPTSMCQPTKVEKMNKKMSYDVGIDIGQSMQSQSYRQVGISIGCIGRDNGQVGHRLKYIGS
jgi:hypothetical protein